MCGFAKLWIGEDAMLLLWEGDGFGVSQCVLPHAQGGLCSRSLWLLDEGSLEGLGHDYIYLLKLAKNVGVLACLIIHNR